MTAPAGGKRRFWAPLIVGLALLVCSCGGAPAAKTSPRPTARPSTAAGPAPSPDRMAPLAVISRNAPAYAVPSSAILTPAAYGDDANYDHEFSARPPVALAYNLSRVPRREREQVLVTWFNNETAFYPPGTPGYNYYNVPEDYTIDVSDASGQVAPPAATSSAWRTLVRVTNNQFGSGMNLIDMGGANWIRMRVTEIRGSVENMNANFKLDIQNAAGGTANTWLFLGDSITAGAMGHQEPTNFPQQIDAADPPYFPAEVNGGVPGWTSSNPLGTDPVTGKQFLEEFLQAIPAHYVTLNFGTNDWDDPNLSTFGANMAEMVKEVQAAGRVAVVPMIPWSCDSLHQQTAPTLNQEVEQLWASNSQIVHGPDFWAYFKEHSSLMSSDCIHPSTPTGMDTYRTVYGQAMASAIYGK
ncbi:MAG TPA: GDSL-type esterase/lipase family protein [Candidatus Dormibacteraeota bacterium]|nr:GDSL-type esterase/lipase family protein [Candidatus Dormibacteraeota bacterium]